jgi:6-phosphogluconolactonase/glucosamine-6-phosphate isomerase/deaminase
MIFKKVDGKTEAADYLLEEINKLTKLNNTLTWFVSGGSNIAITIAVIQKLTDDQLSRINLLLVDERYGPIGHKDSNYQQLLDSGLDTNKINMSPILLGEGFSQTSEDYEVKVSNVFASGNFIIGQLGIGSDGHTAGILPDTIACEETESYVVGYKTEQYDRITLSFKSLRLLDKAYVFAFGEDKDIPLNNIRGRDLRLDEQPAQIFKEIKEAYIINDRIGD